MRVSAPNALLTWFLRNSVVPETADPELLSTPLRSIADEMGAWGRAITDPVDGG